MSQWPGVFWPSSVTSWEFWGKKRVFNLNLNIQPVNGRTQFEHWRLLDTLESGTSYFISINRATPPRYYQLCGIEMLLSNGSNFWKIHQSSSGCYCCGTIYHRDPWKARFLSAASAIDYHRAAEPLSKIFSGGNANLSSNDLCGLH